MHQATGAGPHRPDLDEYLQANLAQEPIACSVAVTDHGELRRHTAYGFAKRYSTDSKGGHITPAELLPRSKWTPAGTDTLFDLASNTKMYATNYALQRLVTQGRLDLDQPLHTFPAWGNFRDEASELTGAWTIGASAGIEAKIPGKAAITIRDLLHHRAGLIPDPAYHNRNIAGRLWLPRADANDRAAIIDALCRTPLRYEPHSQFAYSDADYLILGLLVEQITSTRLDHYLKEEFYAPLGLKNTMFCPLDAGVSPDRIAATELNGNTRDGNVDFGSLEAGGEVPIRRYTLQGEVHDEKAYYTMGGISGHAGLFSTTGDLAVLMQLMLTGGRRHGREYFSAQVAAEFTRPFAADGEIPGESTIGLGWRIVPDHGKSDWLASKAATAGSFGHTGWTGTLTLIDPEREMTIAVLTNRRHSPVSHPPNGFATDHNPVAALAPVAAVAGGPPSF